MLGRLAALLFFSLASRAFAQCADSRPNEPVTVGFRIVKIPHGPKTAIWYPTRSAEASFAYSRFLHGSVAIDASVSDCQRYPLVIFSHGLDGCATQSVFFTEQLARAGYIVAAPDHRDAGCSSDGHGFVRWHLPKTSFLSPGRWNERTYFDRHRDLEAVLDWMTTGSTFAALIDQDHIGAVGHSLGGYSVLALAGGWESWRDPRIKAVLLFSPWARPFAAHQRLNAIRVPVMYQGAQLDLGITPWLRGEKGIVARSQNPKAYLELRGGTHLEWTNAVCLGHISIAGCLEKKNNARLIVEYGTAFLDRYLRGRSDEWTRLDGVGLRAFENSTR